VVSEAGGDCGSADGGSSRAGDEFVALSLKDGMSILSLILSYIALTKPSKPA
jgi:hypothetical protein